MDPLGKQQVLLTAEPYLHSTPYTLKSNSKTQHQLPQELPEIPSEGKEAVQAENRRMLLSPLPWMQVGSHRGELAFSFIFTPGLSSTVLQTSYASPDSPFHPVCHE